MSSLSTTDARLLPSGLVILAHGLLLALLVPGGLPRPMPIMPAAMEAALLPPEPVSVQAPPRQHERQHLPPAKPRMPPPLPTSAMPTESPRMAQPRAVTAAESVPQPAPGAPAFPAPPASHAEAVATPPRADAARQGNVPPDYPAVSRRLGEQGRVLLSLFVLADGSLGEVQLKQSSGYRRLDEAAIEAVKKWTFIPARQNGAAVAAWYLQPLLFSLRDAH